MNPSRARDALEIHEVFFTFDFKERDSRVRGLDGEVPFFDCGPSSIRIDSFDSFDFDSDFDEIVLLNWLEIEFLERVPFNENLKLNVENLFFKIEVLKRGKSCKC